MAGAEVEGHAQPRCTSCPVPAGVTGQERERESVGVYRSGVGDGTTPQQVSRELITAENRRTAQTFGLIIVIGSEVLKVVRFCCWKSSVFRQNLEEYVTILKLLILVGATLTSNSLALPHQIRS